MLPAWTTTPECDQRKLFQFGKRIGGTTVDIKDTAVRGQSGHTATQLSKRKRMMMKGLHVGFRVREALKSLL